MDQHLESKVRLRRTQQQIDELLSLYEEGGYSVKEFCQMKGLNPGNFHKWLSRRKTAGSNRTTLSGFSRVVLQTSPADQLFAEVKGIRFYQVVSAAYLKELLG
jgi:transposase-like protein